MRNLETSIINLDYGKNEIAETDEVYETMQDDLFNLLVVEYVEANMAPQKPTSQDEPMMNPLADI